MELRKLAQGGDASAQNELGLLYYEGKGIPQDHRKAKEWFDKAVEQGHAGAQVNLGTLYLRGEGAPQSSQMALFWFTRAAAQEDALAFAKLVSMYAQGSADARDALAKQMMPAQIAEAQRLAREWRPREEKSRKTVY
jgi:TPR repeat protein